MAGAFNAIGQLGVARDKYGKTHFRAARGHSIANQDLYPHSKDPQLVMGGSVSLSIGYTKNWRSNSFLEMVGEPSPGHGFSYKSS